jgi:hypothetical protein
MNNKNQSIVLHINTLHYYSLFTNYSLLIFNYVFTAIPSKIQRHIHPAYLPRMWPKAEFHALFRWQYQRTNSQNRWQM